MTTRSCVLLLVALASCEKAAERSEDKPPAPVPVPIAIDASTPPPPTSSCKLLVAQLTKDGIWVGSPPSVRCYGVHTASGPDFEWYERELGRLLAALEPTCKLTHLELAASDVAYADVITAMDIAIKRGLVDVGLTDSPGLSMQFASPPKTSTECAGVRVVNADALSIPPPKLPPSPPPLLLVVAISVDTIYVRNVAVIDVADVANGSGPIPELVKALGPPQPDLVVALQADARVAATVINRVVESSKQAGYDDILLATQNKQP
jgi:biopolymer transport protein ExbD